MKDKDKDVEVKITPVRVILFVVTFVVAIAAIGYGVYRMGYKAPGYYSVTEVFDEEAEMYGSDYELVCYFEGSSNEIKSAMNTLSELYSSTLMRAYKLTDPTNEYMGYVNLATINKNPGTPQKVSSELYKMLKDANERSDRRTYNLYAGALYSHWNSILYLSDAENYDPLVNEEEQKRIAVLSTETAKESAVSLVFDDANGTVTLVVSPEYAAFCLENEESENYIDLNLLRSAYVLDMLYTELSSKGYTNGYLKAEDGLYRALSAYSGGEYCMYTNNGNIEKYKTVPVEANSCCILFRSFALTKGEMSYYSVTLDGKTYFRHPYTNLSETGYSNIVQSAMVISYDSAAEAAYCTCRILAATSPEEIKAVEAEFTQINNNQLYYVIVQ